MDFKEYARKHNQLYIPYVANKFGMSIEQACRELKNMWDKFPNPCMVDDLLYTDYMPRRWHYEVCDTKYRRGKSVPHDQLQQHWLDNQKYDQHISVFGHDEAWLDNIRETGSVSCSQTQVKSEIFWIELDRKDYKKRPSFMQAIRDGQQLRNRILTYDPRAQVWVFTSGNNSTHIAINANLFGGPIVSQNNTPVFRFLAELLTQGLRFDLKTPARRMSEDELRVALQQAYPEVTIIEDREPESETEFEWDAQVAESALEDCDTNIYHTNALIRQPWSWHEKGENRKSLVSLDGDFKYEPKLLDIKRQKPSLLHLYVQAWKKLKDSKKKRQKKVASGYSSDYIIREYKRHYPNITEMEPDEGGWIGRFHSIFYDDGNPDVLINIENGYHYDFGSHRYSMSFEDFLIKTKKWYD